MIYLIKVCLIVEDFILIKGGIFYLIVVWEKKRERKKKK